MNNGIMCNKCYSYFIAAFILFLYTKPRHETTLKRERYIGNYRFYMQMERNHCYRSCQRQTRSEQGHKAGSLRDETSRCTGVYRLLSWMRSSSLSVDPSSLDLAALLSPASDGDLRGLDATELEMDGG